MQSQQQQQLEKIARGILKLPIEKKVYAIHEALIDEALDQTDGNRSAAARLLGLYRRTLQRRLTYRRRAKPFRSRRPSRRKPTGGRRQPWAQAPGRRPRA